MVKSMRSVWLGLFQRVESQPVDVRASGAARGGAERYPTHARVVLPDDQLMTVRHASLAAAKDLLAAQRAAERRMAAARSARVRRGVEGIVANAEPLH
ncbi:MAG TPA: hypothetical protein VF812_15535 [Ktedonobacterales bacterium]